MINLDMLPRDRDVPYLGWYLETAPEVLETYTCYAWEDQGEGAFRVKARAGSTATEAEVRFEESRALSVHVARGKIFLGTWRQGEEYRANTGERRVLSTPLIRDFILRGLHRLYERGFGEGDFQVDLDGIALELGVKRQLVDRAVDFLFEKGLIQDYGVLGANRGTGDFWLSHEGAEYIENQGRPVELFLQELYRSTIARLFALDPGLSEALENLHDRAARPTTLATSRQELVGFASMVRDFVQALTDNLHRRTNPAEMLPREQTINKVRAVTGGASSETSRDHVRALAEVVETHWRRLNDIQQKAIHEGTVEAQRLFTYTLLFVVDLLDVIEAE